MLVLCLVLFPAITRASHYQARFELITPTYNEGRRLVEFKTDKVDVAYKALEANEDSLIFKVYFTNLSKNTVSVDSSLFNITSLNTQEKFDGENPEDIDSDIDKSLYFSKTVLKPDESTGGRVVFAVKNALGSWLFKNKFTSHSFKFDVKEVSE